MLQIDNLAFDALGPALLRRRVGRRCPWAPRSGWSGRNGVGKSTLFKLILGELHAGGGEISLPKAARIGSVDQEHPATPVSLIDTILAADVERDGAQRRGWRPPSRRSWARSTRRLIEIDADARAVARRGDPRRPRLLHRRPGAADGGVLRRLAHARGAGRGAVRRSPTCCCSTSRPTTSTSKARSGSRRG